MSAPGSKLTGLSWRALHSATRNQSNLCRASIPVTQRTKTAKHVQSSTRRWNSAFAPRVGKAVELPTSSDEPPPPSSAAAAPAATPSSEQTQPEPTEPPEQVTDTSRSVIKTEDQGTFESSSVEDLKRQHAESILSRATSPTTDGVNAGSDGQETGSKSPLDEVLGKEPPKTGPHRRHPHMSPPPYVHHFDSYSMVKQLQDNGYMTSQAIEAMKGIRALLAQNLDVAQESLVSKSDVENESYLFRAACSELRQEIKNNRRLQDEQIRQQRTHLQHEVDILTQSLNQEASTLNDNVRGMFNDRKMTVREEQRTADSDVQQINYKISTSLTSDSKSEIEGVRWILIRRSVLGIVFMAILTLGTVRYATHLMNEHQKEEKRRYDQEEKIRRDGGRKDRTEAADAAAILAAN